MAPAELDEDALEAAGRDAIAGQIAQARELGVDAAAWLPSEPGAEALGDFAARHGAATVVLPEGLETEGRGERLRAGATDPGAAVRARSNARVVIVPRPVAE